MSYQAQGLTSPHSADDGDEDFETFIANRRRRRDDISITSGRADHGMNHLSAEPVRRPPVAMSKLHLGNSTPEAEAQNSSDVTVALEPRNRGKETHAFLIYKEPSVDDEDPDFNTDINCFTSPIPLPRQEIVQSPLFVDQSESTVSSAQASRMSSISQLLPVDYDSETERTIQSHLNEYRDIPLANEGRKKGTTRSTTMKDMFSQPQFVNTIRDNPYTSGIFTYQGLSKQETIAKVEHERKSTTPGYNAKATRRVAAGNLKPQKRKSVVSPALSQSSYSISNKQHRSQRQERIGALGSTSKRTVNKPSFGNDVPRTMCGSQRVMSTDCFGPTTGSDAHSQPDYAQSFTATTSIGVFLRSHADKYEQCLLRLGSPCVQDDEHWRQMEAQIQPEIDYLVQGLQKDVEGNANVFRMNVQAWDTDIGARAILQKYLMYRALLKSIPNV